MEKTCTRCGQTKPLAQFTPNKQFSGGRRPECNPCLNAYRRAARAAKPEVYTAVARRRYARNPELAKAYSSNWRANNPEKARAVRIAYHARRMGAAGSFTGAQWIELCNRYDNKCVACDSTELLTVDHIVPLSKGGDNFISNIQPLCGRCNATKNVKTIDYRETQA